MSPYLPAVAAGNAEKLKVNMTRRALISVSDKTGVIEFAQGLVTQGFEILSTGGTSKHLQDAGVPVTDVSEVTKFPEILGGRVKTLNPLIHGGILGRPGLESDAAEMAEHGISSIEVVCCNLYPFEETVAKPDVTLEQAVEKTDIGGPCMVRAAAKNHQYVLPVTDASQYESVLNALGSGEVSPAFRLQLAAAAFQRTAAYDRAIADYYSSQCENADAQDLSLNFKLASSLRYGENPHQWASFYVEPTAGPTTLAAAEQLHGKELSYNNLIDLDAALQIVREFEEPASVVIKHTNPCGCAVADSLEVAFLNAYAGDPVSAFGSILGFNRNVDIATAERLCEPNRFIEAIIAPGYDEAAIELLRTKPKWKNNVRLLALPALCDAAAASIDYRRVTGGMLAQERDDRPEQQDDWKIVTDRQPSDAEMAELAFAWRVCKHVKSNAILFSSNRSVVGVGAGQMSRLDSSFIAAHKAGDRAKGAVVASDAFFPFRDGVDEAAKSGVTAVIQPGGSRNDEEVIAACNEHGLAMVFTGRRHFRH